MRVIINPEVKKYLPYILIACIAATLLVLFVDYKYAERYSDFVSVDAVITNVRREATYHGESQKTSSMDGETAVNHRLSVGYNGCKSVR